MYRLEVVIPGVPPSDSRGDARQGLPNRLWLKEKWLITELQPAPYGRTGRRRPFLLAGVALNGVLGPSLEGGGEWRVL